MSLGTALIASLALAAAAAPLAQRGTSPFPTSKYTSKVTRQRNVAGGGSRALSTLTSNQAVLSTDSQAIYTDLTFGSKPFKVILDTGSSDTWLVETGFQCQDMEGDNITEATCSFGPTFSPGDSFKINPNEYFETSYSDGEVATGIVGNDTLTIAGVQVTNQEIGIVNQTYWNGDNITSGLMGLSYSALTSAFLNNPDNDNSTGNGTGAELYSSIINTIFFVENLTEPLFSMALARNSEVEGFGGYFALGGTPDLAMPAINASSTFATVPIQQTGYVSPNLTYEYYTINIDGLTYGNVSGQGATQFIVDSGTTLNYAPTYETAAINALFDPPSFPNDYNGLYYVPCDATAPRVGVQIGGQTFYMQPQDLISDTTGFANNTCYSGFQDGGMLPSQGNFILGDVFMTNALVVFDVGKAEMSFSAREYYTSSG